MKFLYATVTLKELKPGGPRFATCMSHENKVLISLRPQLRPDQPHLPVVSTLLRIVTATTV
jgi:hypothetical protein